jgi:DNA-binding SARP family transcriptional activator
MDSLLRLLGGVSLQRGGIPVGGRARQRHRLALLALIGIAPAGVSRDRLIALLWPDAQPDRARHLLSHSLYVLRRALGEDAIVLGGDAVRMNPESVRCDVRAFEHALREGDHAGAAALYTGAFLDGFFLADSVEFERWADAERERLAQEYAAALEALAFEREAAGDREHALEWWRRLSAHDPYNSRTAMRVVRALEAAGDVAGAFRHARVHEALLREDLGVGLPGEMVEEIERLRREHVGRSTDDSAPATSPSAVQRALEHAPADNRRRLPLAPLGERVRWQPWSASRGGWPRRVLRRRRPRLSGSSPRPPPTASRCSTSTTCRPRRRTPIWPTGSRKP